MKVFTKRLSIKILAFLLMGVLSLGGLFLHRGVKANATGTEEIATTDLLTTTANNVALENGLRISSSSPYEGEIKGIFKGDTTLKFTFPEKQEERNDCKAGDFRIRVTDVDDAFNYFDVVYYAGRTNLGLWFLTGMVVEYDGLTRAMMYDGSKILTSKTANNKMEQYVAAPCFLTDLKWNGPGQLAASAREGLLTFQWDDKGVLSVLNNGINKDDCGIVDLTDQTEVAKFDGTYDPTAANNGVFENTAYGLPKIDEFKEGYRISISSNFSSTLTDDEATDVCIKEITSNGTSYDFTAEKVTTPSFYTDYLSWKENSITEEVRLTDLIETTGTVTQDENGLRISSDAAYTATLKGVFTGDATLKFKFPETFTNQSWFGGDFKIRVTDATDESNYFDVVYYVGLTRTQADTTAYPTGYSYCVTNMGIEYNGLYRSVNYANNNVMSKRGSGAHWGSPVFLSHFQYNTGAANTAAGEREGVLTFDWDDDGVLYVKNQRSDKGAEYTVAAFDGTEAPVVNNKKVEAFGLPKLSFKDGYKISFSSKFTVAGTDDHATDVCFTEIAGVDFSKEIVESTCSFKTTFENATVSSNNVYIPQNVEIGEIKGVYTRSYGLGWQMSETIAITQTVDTSTIEQKSFTVTNDAWKETPLGEVSRTYTVHVEKPYTLTIDVDGGETIKRVVHSEHTTNRISSPEEPERMFWVFDGWYIGNEEWSGDLSKLYGKDVTLTARWLDEEDPTIWLNGEKGVNDVTYVTKGATITISAADVVAGDAAQNDSIVVTFALKKPNETDFTKFTNDTLTLDTVGSYVIQYTATDLAGHTATCERTIAVHERSVPTFTVEEGFRVSANPGLSVALATVTAKNADGEALDIIVSVVKDGVLIENDGTSFLPTVTGEYTVTFFAADKEPYETLCSMYSYTVVVLNDEVAPEIGNEFTDMTVKKNTKITIPTVTATDNVSGSVPVKVLVYYGTQEIALTNNTFTADQEGTYSVLFVAEDEAGNKAEKTVYVTVEMEANGGKGGGGCSGCGASGDLGLPMGLLMIAGSFVFGKNIMMKKIKRKESI